MTNMLKRPVHLAVIVFASLAWPFPVPLMAQATSSPSAPEWIVSFDSEISVNLDSTLQVRENITVLATGAQIKNEVCRGIPTSYSDRFGNPYLIHFEVLSVNRDDQSVDFHLERFEGGMRLCVGNAREPIPPGVHTYELTYSVNRELGFFPEYDELYWNVTGNGWKIPIEVATATVHLPKGVAQGAILLDGYTGRQGSVANNFTSSADAQSNAGFRTTRPLAPSEGLTLVVRWPKGFVHPPTEAQKHQYFLDDNQSGLVGLLGLGVILVYYVLVWFVAGRGHVTGETVPRSRPPRGFSPAALRYVWRMAFDQKTLMVDFVDLAVKKQLAILEDATGSYILGRLKSRRRARINPGSSDGAPAEVTSDEKLVLEKIFAAGDPIPLKPNNHARVGGAVEALHQHLRFKLELVYFFTTSRYIVPGLLISLAAVIRSGLAIQGVQRQVLILVTVAVLLWSLACLAFGGLAVGTWKNAFADPHYAPAAKKQALFAGAVFLMLLVGEVVGLGTLAWAASTEVALILVFLVSINYFFHLRLRSQTLSAHALMDQIEGLRLFLITAGEDTADAEAAPSFTPELFERLLPYALALNVEKIWGDKFAAALAGMPHGDEGDYSPAWYSGPNWNLNTASAFLTSLGSSFSSALSWSTSGAGSRSGSYGSSDASGG
jgi:hypothetical protein